MGDHEIEADCDTGPKGVREQFPHAFGTFITTPTQMQESCYQRRDEFQYKVETI